LTYRLSSLRPTYTTLSGSGLGKAGQGRLEPVGLSKQKGRRGLGLVIQARQTRSEMLQQKYFLIIISLYDKTFVMLKTEALF
jgi:hypothetical protein